MASNNKGLDEQIKHWLYDVLICFIACLIKMISMLNINEYKQKWSQSVFYGQTKHVSKNVALVPLVPLVPVL